jgi:hypothetical protein
MAQETLKITITADNQQAVKNIQETVTATTKLGTAFKTLPSTSNQATNVLMNVSRVAQDASYGFMGIANNLNPLLESFQRLQAQSGSTTTALKSMAQGLMGPAGIGLALGVVSSIIVSYGSKISDFITGTNEASKAEDKFATSLKDARSEASETGIRLQSYLAISQNANVSEERRAEAFRAVVTELGKVNSAYASTITNVDQARKAVDLYTQSLVNQALTSRYIDQIADKTIALADANKKILLSGREYYKQLAIATALINQNVYATIGQADVTDNAAKANINARKEANGLKTEIIGLRTEVNNLLVTSAANPFFNFTKGANALAKSTKEVADNIQKIGGQANAITGDMTAPVLMQRGAAPTITPPTGNAPLGGRTSGFNAIVRSKEALDASQALKGYNMQLELANSITNSLTPAFETMFQAMANGESIGQALEATFKQIVAQLTAMIVKALIFKTVMGALGLPTFGGGGAGGGLTNFTPMGAATDGGNFVLKGNDLVLAMQRSNSALNLRRGV